MSEAIVVALITGGMSLIGVVITCMAAARKTEKAAAVAQAVTDTKIDELSRKVEKHNNMIERTYQLEGRMNEVEHDIKDLKGKVA